MRELPGRCPPSRDLRWSTVLLLAFDTATPAVTVALHDGVRVLAEESSVDARRHGELLAASIERVLAASGAAAGDLTGIAVGVGPGPYTGLRAGLVTARVLGSALGIPVHGACTLDVIARAAARGLAASGLGGRDFLVATDARRKEVYWARHAPRRSASAGPRSPRPASLTPAARWPAKEPCSTPRNWARRSGHATHRPPGWPS